MKKTKSIIISALVAASAVCLCVAFSACGSKEKHSKTSYGYGEEGWYYYDTAAGSEYLMSLQSGTYMVSEGGSKSYAGTYSYAAGESVVSFESEEGDAFEAMFADDAMKLSITGTPYTFLKRVEYTVTFMDGDAAVASQFVIYGKNAAAVDGEKDGYIFLGWYEDSFFAESSYKFNTAVTGDLTLYARYVEIDPDALNFEVKFVSGGDVIYTTTTQNGVVYDFPDGKVDGWWVSATNNADELTYRYDGEVLKEATTLYAVEGLALGASVYADRVAWEAAASSVAVYVDGGVVASNVTTGYYSYDFEGLSAGRHEITVSSGSVSETRVYMSKALSRVSNFEVYGDVLVYNAVENAQYYRITVECGSPSHSHEMVYNGNTLTYDFSECEMGAEGIKFTVYAYATGYAGSVSETFTYLLKLGGALVTIDENTDTASWATVYDVTGTQTAAGYEIYVNDEYVDTVTDTSYSFKYYGKCNGDETLSISVKPVAPGYYSEKSGEVSYAKTSLGAPQICEISDYYISWTEVEDAIGYEVSINGYIIDLYPAVEGEEAPTKIYIGNGDSDEEASGYYSYILDGINVISVMALASDGKNSQFCDAVYATELTMYPVLSYKDGTVSWTAALAAGTYYVDYEGEVTEIDGAISFDLTFTHSGENIIKVYFDESSYAEINIYTYAVIFDLREFGGEPVDTLYVAKGDKIMTSEAEPSSVVVSFGGWYTLPDEYDPYALDYTGAGVEFVSGTTFTGNSTLVLYACWIGNKAEIHLEAMDAGFMEDTTAYIVYNSSDYTLPVPEIVDTTKVFMGWYSEPYGMGVAYTDHTGYGKNILTGSASTTFYACYGEAVALSRTTYGGETVLEAAKGEDIEYVTGGVVTVPASYTVGGTGYTVAVLNAGSFGDLDFIYEINIPDTMLYVGTTENGYSAGTGAFSRSANIRAVNVYATGDEPDTAKEISYYSEDGVLFYKNNLTSHLELIYYPQGKTTETYVIPEYVYNENECAPASVGGTAPVYRAVTSIAMKVFYANPYVVTVVIPATVENIDTQAFSSCKRLETVTMLAAVSGDKVEAATTLSVASDAFKSCAQLKTVTLASRLSSFDCDMFSGCVRLTNVEVNSTGVAEVDNFSSCDGYLLNAAGNVLVYWPAGRSDFSLTNEAVTEIGERAVYGCTNISSVVIPTQIKVIGESAFYGCTGITSLTFASKGNENAQNLEIGARAFYGCTGISSLVLPENVTKIGEGAFGNCTRITYVYFDAEPGTDELEYADGAFGSASGSYYVTSLEIGANAPAVNIAAVFGYNISNIVIASENENYETSVTGLVMDKDGETVLYCLANYSGEVVLPGTTKKIVDNVFTSRSITSITIPASVTEIGDSAFYNCRYLTTVEFTGEREAESLTIGGYAFAGCVALKNITLPEGLTEIGDGAFQGCSNLEEITLPEGLEKIGDHVFRNCSSLEEVIFPSTLEEMGSDSYGAYGVFEGCDKLASIEVTGNSTHFAFDGGILYVISDGSDGNYVKTGICIALSSATGEIVLPGTVENIWYRAFYGNSGITGISFDGELASNLTIGDEAFNGCTGLRSIVLPEGLTSLTSGLFTNCTSLTTITIPTTVTSMSNGVFSGCSSVEEIAFTEGGSNTLTFETGTSSKNVFTGTSLKTVTLPDRVTQIPDYLFYGITTLEYVYVPYTVTSIGADAFANCTALVKVEIEDNSEETRESGLVTIGKSAFWQCSALTEINLPDSITTITAGSAAASDGTATTAGAFEKCTSLEEISLPASVTTIGIHTFWGCESLKTVTVKGAVTSVANYSFRGCTALETITFEQGDALTSIGTQSFYESGLTSITIPKNVTTINGNAFYGCANLKTLTFAVDDETRKSALTTISANAFEGSGLESLAFPESTGDISLGNYAFASCEKLKTLHISSSVTDISASFSGTTNIETITVAGGGSFTMKTLSGGVSLLLSGSESAGYTLHGAYGLANVNGELDLTGENIVTINKNAFALNDKLIKITIPYTVTNLGQNAFWSCENLKTVVFEDLPESFEAADYMLTITEGNNASSPALTTNCGVFWGCASLEDINLPERLTTLPKGTFINCTSLQKLAVPDTVTTIGSYVFGQSATYACTNLKEITFGENSSLTTLSTYSFYYCTALESIEIPAGVTSISVTYVFRSCTSLESVTFLSNTLSITATGTFYECNSLETIDLVGTGIAQIPENTFYNCYALKEITIPYTVTTIGKCAFYGCTGLKSIVFETVPEGGTGSTVSIDAGTKSAEGTFYNCTSLKKIVLTDRVETISAYAFSGCTSLKVVTYAGDENYLSSEEENYLEEGYFSLMEEVTLGNYAFENCGLIVADISNLAATAVGTYVFSGCTNLSELKINEEMTYIPAGFVNGCSSLVSFEIPSGVTEIGDSAFAGTAITTISIPEAVTKIGASTFSGCTELAEVVFEKEGQITSVGGEAFRNCTSLTSLDLSAVTSVGGAGAFQGSGLVEAHVPNLQITANSSTTYCTFEGCEDLVEVELNPGLTMIPNYTFQNCESLTKIYYTGYTADGYAEDENVLPGSLTTIGTYAFSSSGLETIVIPGSVTTLGANTTATTQGGAFSGASALKEVVIEDGVKSIEMFAFLNCESLEKVVIPYTVTTVKCGAFSGCINLRTVTFEELPAGELESEYELSFWGGTNDYQGVFYNCVNLAKITLPERTVDLGGRMFKSSGITEITIPQNVTTFKRGTSASGTASNAYTFTDCTELRDVVFKVGSSLTTVGEYTFQGCTSLEAVSLPDTLTTIPTNAFENCSSLESISLPASVTTISNYAFRYTGLEEIVIPTSVTSIGTRTFEACPNLIDFTVETGNSKYASVDGVLVELSSNSVMCYPAGREGEAVVGDNLLLTTSYAFSGCDKITRVVLGASCTQVASNMFEGCTALEEIVIPSTTVTIQSSAFDGAESLKAVYYMGTEEQWAEMSVSSTGNSNLTDAVWYFYSSSEPEKETAGNFWHYNADGEIEIW